MRFKLRCVTCAIALVSYALLGSGLVLADLGQINLMIHATLVSNACTISPESLNQTVNLGSLGIKQLRDSQAANPTQFIINLEDCGIGASGVSVRFDGTQDQNDSSLFALTPESTANHVGIELLDRNLNHISPGDHSSNYPLVPHSAQTPLVFYARYKKTTGIIQAGTVDSIVTFTLEYL